MPNKNCQPWIRLKFPASLVAVALASSYILGTSAGYAQTAVDETNAVRMLNATGASSGSASYSWRVSNPKAIVIAVHGMTQQAGCFSTLSEHLNRAGFTLVAMDLRGHGKWYFSDSASGEKHTLNYGKSVADLQELAQSLREQYPGVPLFAIGESVGSGVTTLAAGKRPDLFDGIILVSAGSRPRFYNPLMVTKDFAVGITHLDRQLDVREYITRYSSEDPRITHEMITDHLSRTTLTGREILKTAAFIRKIPNSAAKLSPKTSVLVLQGAKDKITSTPSVKSTLRKIASANKKMVVFDKCGHILLGTAFLKPAVVEELTSWLVQQSESTPHTLATVQRSPDEAVSIGP